MKMKYTILYVNDVEASIHFYQQVLGFPIKLRVESYVEFDTGDVTLSINSRQDVKEALGLPFLMQIKRLKRLKLALLWMMWSKRLHQ